eukprot:COSAG02_NODE_2154_length_9654_cov_5.613919_3_plen_1108_part_00
MLQELFESNGLEMVTMSVAGDGNCMAHSISRAICGLEVFFHVLRTELLAELESNVEFYRDLSIASGFYTDDDWDRDLASAGPSQMGQAGMWMSGMHIFGMANVLRRPIFLVDARQNASATEPDLMVVTQLVEMGFTQHAALRAAIACQNHLDECMQWVLDHEHDPMLNEPMDPSSHHRAASASARGGLFLPLRFTPEECQVDGVMPSPLMIACANADASHFCSVVTVQEPEAADDGMMWANWTVPEGAEGGKQFSDTIEVNGVQVAITGTVPHDALPGDQLRIAISSPGGMRRRSAGGKVTKTLVQELKQNSGLQQRQLSSTLHRIVEAGTAIVHALSMLLTGHRCEPEPDDTEQLFEDYRSGMGKEPIGVVFVNTVPEDLTIAQIMSDGRLGKTWPLFGHGQLVITTPVGAHFRMLNANNERVWSVTIRDEHAVEDMIMVDTSQHVVAQALEPRSLGAIQVVVHCLGAIVANPDTPKVRRLPLTNKTVSERLLPVDGARELLEAVGFVEEIVDGKRSLHLPDSNLDLAQLSGVLVTLRSALSTKVQHPHPFQFAITASDDADDADGAALKPSISPSLSGQSSAGGAGNAGNAGWFDVAARADSVRRHVLEVTGGLSLIENVGGFKRSERSSTGFDFAAAVGRSSSDGGDGGGSAGGPGGAAAGAHKSLCLQTTDLRSGLESLEALEDAQAQLLAASASRLRFGIDSEAFGQIQFTQQKCEANDWDYARRYANGDGCWEFGCGKSGAEPTTELMKNARTRFSQLVGKDLRAAMRKHIPVTCTGCQAALVVTQQQVESAKGSMLEISCPACRTPVTLTAPTLHDEIQDALNREAEAKGVSRSSSGSGRGGVVSRATSSGSSITSTSSAGSSGSGHVLGRPGSAPEDHGGSMSIIDSITPYVAVPRSSSKGGSVTGSSIDSNSSRHKPELELEPEPSGESPVDVEEAGVYMIQFIDGEETKPEQGMTEAERFVRRRFQSGGNGGDDEFDQVLDKLRRDAMQTGDGSAMLTGRLLEIAEPAQLADPDDGTTLSRNLSLGAVPRSSGPLDASAGDHEFARLVAELSDVSYGFERGAVFRALKASSGDLFKALDLLEADVGAASGSAPAGSG